MNQLIGEIEGFCKDHTHHIWIQTCPGLLSDHSSSNDGRAMEASSTLISETQLFQSVPVLLQLFLYAEISEPHRNYSRETFKVFCSVTGQGIANLNTGSRNSKVQTIEKKIEKSCNLIATS